MSIDIERMTQAATTTKAAAISTGGVTAFFGLSINEIAAVIGATVAVLTLLMNFYFNHRRMKLVEAEMRRTGPPGE